MEAKIVCIVELEEDQTEEELREVIEHALSELMYNAQVTIER